MNKIAELAIDYVLRNEGGYANDPRDPGGETNYGISNRFYSELNIKALTRERAKDIYYNEYWLKHPIFKEISKVTLNLGSGETEDLANQDDQKLITKLFDIYINVGYKASTSILQRALRAIDLTDKIQIADDGIYGRITNELFLKQLVNTNVYEARHLLIALCSETAAYYRILAATKPEMGIFLEGWLNRAYKNP